MDQMQTVPGPSQAAFTALNNQMANIKTNGASLFNTITDITSGATIALSESADNYDYLVLRLTTSSSDTSSSRGIVMIPMVDTSIAAWYPACVAGNMGGIRLSISGTSFTVNGTGGFTSIYIKSIYGCIKTA